ncbi:helix-turn-helix domain-containing protein [Streptomyces acidiscabies]|uniref:helix-turn-helix domain-containing protein n=1 Tax=Streptomyces acidiscabies TaxID=42234 RepID=UPI00076E52D7|nr:helix-turn-helix transcriptional regulator [Streptomyces acidiscabies]GAQ51437.1 hypothetical protein a10_01217 [Streptomyces acidiscabies]
MARGKDIDGSQGVPTFYGKELRWKREQAGMSLDELLVGSFFGRTYLSDIERGERTMPIDLARHVDQRLGTDGYFERNCEDVRKARKSGHAAYFTDVLAMEKRARETAAWEPMLIPGPLQLEPYIRAVVLAAYPNESEESLAAKVADRRERAWLYEDRNSPESWVVLHESVLRDPLLPPNEMADQLAHVVEVLSKRRVQPQVMPRNAGVVPFAMGSTKFMTFPDAPPVMYTEGMYSGQLIDDPQLVQLYSKAYVRLRSAAYDPRTSLKMIEQAAEDYRVGKFPA